MTGGTPSGSGTSASPYIVVDNADLQAISQTKYMNAYIELGSDIVCSGNQTPIGNNSTPFIGHFDGKNHTITNLNVSGAGKQGLFGQCGSSFSISNLKLVNGHVTATDYYCGMLIGYVYQASGAVVENVETVACKVDSSSYYVGGIVGGGANSSSGSVTYRNCYVHDGYVVASSANVGGIVGYGANSSSGAILYDNCRVVSEYVCSTSSYSVGGIVGHGADSSSTKNAKYVDCEVRDCVVKASSYNVGGIVGVGANSSSSATYERCGVYNTVVWSAVSSGEGRVGGICGCTNSGTTVNINDCIVDGCTITAPSGTYVGGIIGRPQGTVNIKNPIVRNCSIIGSGSNVGGMVGSSS